MRATGASRVYALIGHPIRHSPSPRLHNTWFERAGLDAIYVALPAPQPLDDLGGTLRSLGIAGANLTLPHKVASLSSLDEIDPVARACGAVNTVVVREGRTLGLNTDAPGLRAALHEAALDPQGRRCAILGAGGAARAAALALHQSGAHEILLLNRSLPSAQEIFVDLSLPGSAHPLSPAAFARLAPDLDLVINALPGSARGAVQALDTRGLEPSCGWVDLNYWDPDPPHLHALSTRGHPTQGGLPMLLHQAALAFQHFTGQAADLDLGRRVLASPAGGGAPA